MLPLNAYASMVMNDAYGGLKAPMNASVSLEQIKDEFCLLRNRMIQEMALKGVFDPEGHWVPVDELELVWKEAGECAVPFPTWLDTGKKFLYAKIPTLLKATNVHPIRYVGSAFSFRPYKVVRGNEYLYSRYDMMTGKAPTAWITETDELYLLHCPEGRKKAIRLVMLPEDPRELERFGCYGGDDEPFPMPRHMADAIVSKMTNDILRYYRMQQPQPNTGADLVPGAQPEKGAN